MSTLVPGVASWFAAATREKEGGFIQHELASNKLILRIREVEALREILLNAASKEMDTTDSDADVHLLVPQSVTLDEVEGLKKKLESKLDALKPRSAADSKLVGRCGGGGAREGGSEDRAGAVAVQRRRAAAIYRDGQRRVLQEAIQELEGLLDEEDGTGP